MPIAGAERSRRTRGWVCVAECGGLKASGEGAALGGDGVLARWGRDDLGDDLEDGGDDGCDMTSKRRSLGPGEEFNGCWVYGGGNSSAAC